MIARLLLSTVISVLVVQIANVANAKLAENGHHDSAASEPRPYDKKAKAWQDVDATFSRARRSGKRVLLVMGANWCHDSRALAAQFEKPAFQTLINDNYELVYVDVGQKNRNIDIAQVYGIDDIVGTPTVLILDAKGALLNAETAPTWRNAASRSEAEVMTYFTAYADGEIVEAE